uniref:Uncharacterized protein n=1 Tax=Megaselia scalaris TaxID=36166 RepID=T1H464_MEGSC
MSSDNDFLQGNSVKLNKVECGGSERYIQNFICSTKLFEKETILKIELDLMFILNNFTAKLQLFKQQLGGFKPFVLNIKAEGCGILSGKSKSPHPILTIIRKVIMENLNISKSCPIQP